jgi:erythromycin esterase-like protein
MIVRHALDGSYEQLFGGLSPPAFLLSAADVRPVLGQPRLERAIGVIYRPESERWSHYFHARLPEQFDAVIHIHDTTAVEPLEPGEGWSAGGPPETYPSGV